MKTERATWVIAGMAVASLVYTVWLYPALPEQIPTHWDLNGRVDGWMSKEWAAGFGPGMVILFLGLLHALPALSPRQFEVDAFRPTYNLLMVEVAGLIAAIHVLSLQAALHPEMASGRLVTAAVFVFLALMGNLLGKTRRNFWMGIRTPWTLASDAVWLATHRLAARLMVAAGITGALAVGLGAPPAWGFVLMLVVLLIPVVYSLVLYQRLDGA
jgi:uncharacterized membrane protein